MSGRGNPAQRGGGGGGSVSEGRGGSGRGSAHSSEGFGRGRGGPSVRPGGSPHGSGGPRGGFDPRGRGGGSGFRGPPRGRGSSGPVIFKEDTPAQPPARLTDASHAELLTAFKSLKVIPDRPLRPGYGTLGNEITLRANFFSVKVPKGPIYDYAVEITPKSGGSRENSRIFHLLELSPLCNPHLPYIAHDKSQRIVSARKLPQPLDIPVTFYDDHEEGPSAGAKVYGVSIKFERELNTSRLTE